MNNTDQDIRNSFLYLIPVFAGNAIPVITLTVFTRILTEEDYGAWALANVYAAFVTGLANFGLMIGYERTFFQYPSEKHRGELLYSTVTFVLSLLLLWGAVTWLFQVQLATWVIGSPEFSGLLFWAFCAMGVISLKAYYLAYFKNIRNAKAHTWYALNESVLVAVLSLFLVAYLRVGVIGLVLGQLCGSLVILCLVVFRCAKILPPSFNRGILIESLRVSYPLTPRVFLSMIEKHFDKYLIGVLATVGGVGVYTIGQRVARMVFNYMTALENVFAPQVYKRMFSLGDRGGESVGRYLTPFAYASIGIAFLIALFSEEVITVLTPASYHGAIAIVNVLVLYYGIMFFGKQPQLVFAKKTYLISCLSMLSVVISLGLNIVFIRAWGAVGAAWGTFITGLISVTVSFVLGQHYYRIKWEYGKLGAVFGMFMGASILALLLRELSFEYWTRLGVRVALVAGYAWLGVKLNVISRENYIIVRQMLMPKSGLQNV